MKINYDKLGLLPYQIAYLEDESQIKIVEKSRQVGITRTQALESVIHTGIRGSYDTWMSSNNDLNAKEFIRYCKQFADTFNMVVKDLTNQEIVKDTNTYTIEFNNGKRINAVSSNPDQLHGKNGMIVLDEFARRDSEFDTWEAAAPAALIWGRPIRIISTHNGKNTMFFKFLEQIDKGQLLWSRHKITIENAVQQGLADKVKGKTLTLQERLNYINDLKNSVKNETIWKQQFLCEPQNEEETFLPYSLLDPNAKAELLNFNKLKDCKDLYAGLDVGRYKNLSVLWITEKVSKYQLITRFIRTIKSADFPKQEKIIGEYLRLPNMRRLCIDKTGLGIGLNDYLQKTHGKSKVEGVTLTAQNKESMAFRLRKYLEDTAFSIPDNEDIKSDFHSVKQDTTIAGNIRLRAHTNEDTGSHADYFWAAALSLEALAQKQFINPKITGPNAWQQYKLKHFSKILKHFKPI